MKRKGLLDQRAELEKEALRRVGEIDAAVKKLLDELKVTYNNVDVSTDLEAQREMIEKSGQVGVPVVVVDDEVMVGYDRKKLKKKLEVKS